MSILTLTIIAIAVISLLTLFVVSFVGPSASAVRQNLQFLEAGLNQVDLLAVQAELTESDAEKVKAYLRQARLVVEMYAKKRVDYTNYTPEQVKTASGLVDSAMQAVSMARQVIRPYLPEEDED